MDPAAWTMTVGGVPLVTLLDPPPVVLATATTEFPGLLVEGRSDDTIEVSFTTEPPRVPVRHLVSEGTRTLVDARGRFHLVDGAGRTGCLFGAGDTDEALPFHPELDPRPRRMLHRLLSRLFEWEAIRRGMTVVKGSAIAIEGQALAITGFAGMGKTALLLALLRQEHSGYLADERLVLTDAAAVAPVPTPIRLAYGRRYDPDLLRGHVGAPARVLLRLAAASSPIGATGRRLLHDRWLTVEPGATSSPTAGTTPLGALAFLLPGERSVVELDDMDPDVAARRLAHQTAYLHAVFTTPLAAAQAYLQPGSRPRWAELDPFDDRVAAARRSIGTASCVALRIPIGTPASEVEVAVRSLL